jgi:hypothetical protein
MSLGGSRGWNGLSALLDLGSRTWYGRGPLALFGLSFCGGLGYDPGWGSGLLAGLSTAPLAMRLREASLRMTELARVERLQPAL